MKQVAQNYLSGALHLRDVPAPRPARGQVLVATRVSLISSGTERQLRELATASLVSKALARPDLVRRVVAGARREGLRPTIDKVLARLDTPIPLGYSLAGRVIACGPETQGFAVGDRVACAGAGWANHAEAVAVPKHLCAKVPDAVDDTEASFVALGAIALQGVRLAQPTLGERIIVVGLGLIGQLTVQVLRANGCRVLGCDPDASRAALAKSLGADAAVSEGLEAAAKAFTRGAGADAVILTAASRSNEPLNTAAQISRLKGRIVVVGVVGMGIDREPFYRRELDVRISTSTGPGRYDPAYELHGHDYPLAYVRWTEQRNMEAFLELVGDGRVTPHALVTHRFKHDEAERAYAALEGREPSLAIVLEYAGAPPLERRLPVRLAKTRQGDARVGLIGCGRYAKGVLLPVLSRLGGVKLTGVAASTGISALRAAERYGFAWAASDADEIMRDAATDIVFIATPHDSHAALTVAALAAGKHVFCEKPLAITPMQLDDVRDAAGRGATILAVGFNRRFAPLAIRAKAALAPRSGPLVMLARVNAGAAPEEGWGSDPEHGGRVVGEVCHFVDLLTFFAGALPVAVQATAAAGHRDAVSVLLRFADGSTGTIVYSPLGDPAVAKEHIDIFASGCVVQIDDFRRLRVSRRGRMSSVSARQDKGAPALVAAFLAAAKGQACAPIPLREILAVTGATLAIEEALGTGAPVGLETVVAARGASELIPGLPE